MPTGSISSPSVVYMLAIANLFPVPQQLQEYAADDVFGTEPVEVAQTVMGVDGHLAGGFVFSEINQSITLQANSESIAIFQAWYEAQKVLKDVLRATGLVVIPAVGKKWSMSGGILKTYPPIIDVKKILQPQRFSITWESVSPSVI